MKLAFVARSSLITHRRSIIIDLALFRVLAPPPSSDFPATGKKGLWGGRPADFNVCSCARVVTDGGTPEGGRGGRPSLVGDHGGEGCGGVVVGGGAQHKKKQKKKKTKTKKQTHKKPQKKHFQEGY